MKYRGALPRLLSIVDRLAGDLATVAIVDNAMAGDWTHEVAHGIWHIGGDNRAWEFSAFDRGVAHLESQAALGDILLFVTDAFRAYGDAFLELVDGRALHCVRARGACVGWMDSFLEPCTLLGYRYDTWLRTSFLLMPVQVYHRVAPLAAPLDCHIFGETADSPFAGDAPLSDNLRARIVEWLTGASSGGEDRRRLDELWHSRFDLDPKSFEFFRQKAAAILREHLLSAKLKSLGVPCFDLRAVRSLGERGFDFERLDADTSSWQWLSWLPR